MTNNVISMKGVRELPRNAPKAARTKTEAVILTPDAVKAWKAPHFQRPLRVNAKVMEVVEMLKSEPLLPQLPGVLTLGLFEGQKYLIDGQHRVEAFKLSELPEVYAEIRVRICETYGEMSEEYVELNSKLVAMRPDDFLRGMEDYSRGLAKLRRACPFVGYDMIRRGSGANSPVLSMSVLLRCWFASGGDVPASTSTSAIALAGLLTDEEADRVILFLDTAFPAWGHDQEYFRLWGALNLTLSMWLWRNTVLTGYSQKSARLTPAQFGKCLMALSADGTYLDWLVGRLLSERDRSPCYSRVRALFVKRIEADRPGVKILMPGPSWAHGGGTKPGR